MLPMTFKNDKMTKIIKQPKQEVKGVYGQCFKAINHTKGFEPIKVKSGSVLGPRPGTSQDRKFNRYT